MSNSQTPPPTVEDICNGLRARGIDAPSLPALVAALHDDLLTPLAAESSKHADDEGPLGGGLMIPIVRWVVRDDDIQVLQNVIVGLGGVAATGALTPGSSSAKDLLQGVLGVAASLYLIGRALVKKGTRLTILQYAILADLEKSGPSQVDEICARVALQSGVLHEASTVRAELDALRCVFLGDGGTVPLIAEGPDGRVSASGV